MAQFYIDDNGLIYALQFNAQRTSATSGGAVQDMRLGLADAPADSTVPTWIINTIRFRIDGWADADDASDYAIYTWFAGIVPAGNADGYDSLADFQEVKGWPSDQCFGAGGVPNYPGSGTAPGRFSITKTYHPDKTLVLNRMQDIYLGFKTNVGADLFIRPSISVSAKRGR